MKKTKWTSRTPPKIPPTQRSCKNVEESADCGSCNDDDDDEEVYSERTKKRRVPTPAATMTTPATVGTRIFTARLEPPPPPLFS